MTESWTGQNLFYSNQDMSVIILIHAKNDSPPFPNIYTQFLKRTFYFIFDCHKIVKYVKNANICNSKKHWNASFLKTIKNYCPLFPNTYCVSAVKGKAMKHTGCVAGIKLWIIYFVFVPYSFDYSLKPFLQITAFCSLHFSIPPFIWIRFA